jgi:hypothetical protein
MIERDRSLPRKCHDMRYGGAQGRGAPPKITLENRSDAPDRSLRWSCLRKGTSTTIRSCSLTIEHYRLLLARAPDNVMLRQQQRNLPFDPAQS